MGCDRRISDDESDVRGSPFEGPVAKANAVSNSRSGQANNLEKLFLPKPARLAEAGRRVVKRATLYRFLENMCLEAHLSETKVTAEGKVETRRMTGALSLVRVAGVVRSVSSVSVRKHGDLPEQSYVALTVLHAAPR